MSDLFLQTPYKEYDFDAKNKDYSENKYPVKDPVVGERSRTGIVCCTDPRCAAEAFFKLREQEVFTIRVEGGRAADPAVVRTLTLIDTLVAPAGSCFHEVMVVHHTDCVALQHHQNEILEIIRRNNPNVPGGPWKPGAFAYAEAVPFLQFPEAKTEREQLEKSLRQDVEFLRNHPLWRPKIKVSGWIYHIRTGVAERLDI